MKIVVTIASQPDYQVTRRAMQWRRVSRQQWPIYGMNGLLLLALLLPFYWTIISSLKREEDIVTYPPRFVPNPWTLEHYTRLLTDPGTHVMIKNSFLIVLGTVCLVSVCATTAGFAIAKINFRGRKCLFALIIMAMLLPFQSIVVPLFLEMNLLGLVNTRLALILTSATLQLPLGLLIMKNAFDALPVELMEAAQLDGCNYVQMFWRIMVPNVKAGLATVVVLTSATVWNEFLPALVFMTTKDKYTLSIGLGLSETILSGPMVALSVITFVPMLILFLFAQRYFMAGVSSGILSAE